MKPRQKRIVFVLIALVAVGAAGFLANSALQSNISYFYNPTQIVNGEAPKGQVIRIGGMVKEGSMKRLDDGLTVAFIITNHNDEAAAQYTGILPDLFKEGQGAVAKGKLNEDNVLIASEVLAKHDEDYLPPEVADAMDKARAASAQSTQETTP